jgi:hypothetical protein
VKIESLRGGGWFVQASRLGVSLLLTAALLELGTLVLVRLGVLSTPEPPYRRKLFWSSHPLFGVWHPPLTSFRHRTACFDVTYESNSVGTRDVERTLDSKNSRVVVLGDSFIEGWGLTLPERLSSLLENATGIEHLNFGTAHFGPYQEYLSYRELAKKYSHEAVIVAVLPVNDFFDLDYELAQESAWYDYRYRPYLVGEYPRYRTINYREPTLKRLGRRYLYSYNAFAEVFSRFQSEDSAGKARRKSAGVTFSYFYDFTEPQFELLRYCLEKIALEAGGRRVAVVLIPAYQDFVRCLQSGESPLPHRLREVSSGLFRVVDLLPYMYAYTPDWQNYYFSCDYHWTALANRVAAEYLRKELGEYLYGPGGLARRSGALREGAEAAR